MATGSATWDASTDLNWTTVDANWTPAQHPADGDTATFDGTEAGALALPNANLPTTGTIDMVFTAGYEYTDFPGGGTLQDLMSGAAVGDVSVNHADASLYNTTLAGTITIVAGVVWQGGVGTNTASYVLNGAGAALIFDTDTQTLTGTITDGGAGGEVYVASAVTVSSAITTGTVNFNIDGGGTLVNSTVTVSNGGSIVAYADNTDVRQITGAVTVESGGTFDWSIDTQDFTVTSNFTRSAGGILVGNAGGELILMGDANLSGAGGSFTNTYIRMKGTGSFASFNLWTQGLIVDATSTTTAAVGTSFTTDLVVESGGVLNGGATAIVTARRPTANGVDIAGNCNCVIVIPFISNLAMSGRLATTEMLEIQGRNDTLTHSGVMDVADLVIRSQFNDNEYGRLDSTGASFTAGSVTLGVGDGTDRYGILDVSGVSGAVTIGDLVDAAGGSSALALGAKAITISSGSTWDGTNIDSSGSGSVTGDATVTISNMDDPGATIDVLGGIIDGGGNDPNWIFPAGQMMMMGIG